ncbi:hypothetical protein CJA_0331 [Cellvibrio japonicus Ueda107]|uniref:Uncharacterized protein n=1 Tax=Cellvibrio japonicus (strain Ueda107) TaxID=498211 RepID=B3PHD4_CELJU|nr:hypothetical protein CJA_0331 [Cellvibrio japonicus Ueda107]
MRSWKRIQTNHKKSDDYGIAAGKSLFGALAQWNACYRDVCNGYANPQKVHFLMVNWRLNSE